MHTSPVIVTGSITVGATGAVASFTGSVVQSITRTSTGLYQITLQPNTNFSKLYHLSGAAQSPVSGLSGVLAIECQNAPQPALASYTAIRGGQVSIKCLDAAGALVDPATGSVITILMFLSNSSV